jgi:hypothetical protein
MPLDPAASFLSGTSYWEFPVAQRLTVGSPCSVTSVSLDFTGCMPT